MEKKRNLWVIPTDKPSRLHITSKLMLYPNGLMPKSQGLCKNQHIYITSDEEIKEGDYVLYHEDKISQVLGINIDELKLDRGGVWRSSCKKIILTTDQDLIKDGVQAIDDEFLQWFAKNPSCEEVEVAKGKMKLNDDGQEYGFPDMSLYKIIISQEEPKQELERGITITHIGKQKTLEEAAEKYAKQFDWAEDSSPQLDFIAGAKSDAARDYWFKVFKEQFIVSSSGK
jgi:hypothetical protein